MKNTKITKIALLVLSVALLVGAAIGFSVSAEETAKEYKILAKNVVYGDKTAVAVAVDATIEEANAETVKVAYYWEEDGYASYENAKLLDTSVAKNLYDDKNPVFVAAGVAAKDLGDVLRLVAYTGEVPAEDDTGWISYSAAEYFYSRLYKDGFINKTEADGIDYNRRLMYEGQLQLSANAQKVLDVDEDGNYIGGTYVDEYNYAYTTNKDVKINGGKTAFDVDTVTATYHNDKTTLKLVGWTVTYEDMTNPEYKNTVTYGPSDAINVEKATCIVPELEEHTCADNNSDHFCDSCPERISYCADSDSNGACDTCKTYTFEYTVNGGVSFLQFNSKSYSTSRIYLYQTTVSTDAPTYSTFGCSGQLIADPANAANQVLRWALNDGVKADGTNQDTSNAVDVDGTKTSILTGHSIIKFEASTVKEGGNIHILEMDFNLREIGKNKYNTISSPFRLYAYNSDGEVIGDFYKTSSSGNFNGFMYIDQTNYIYDKSAGTYTLDTNDANAYHFGNHSGRTDNRTDASNLIMFDRNEWYRFRFVWDVSTNAIGMEVSFDDGAHWYLCYDYTSANAITEGEEIAYLGFQLDTIYGIGMDILLDDVTYKVVDTHTRATEYGKDSVEASYGK